MAAPTPTPCPCITPNAEPYLTIIKSWNGSFTVTQCSSCIYRGIGGTVAFQPIDVNCLPSGPETQEYTIGIWMEIRPAIFEVSAGLWQPNLCSLSGGPEYSLTAKDPLFQCSGFFNSTTFETCFSVAPKPFFTWAGWTFTACT